MLPLLLGFSHKIDVVGRCDFLPCLGHGVFNAVANVWSLPLKVSITIKDNRVKELQQRPTRNA